MKPFEFPHSLSVQLSQDRMKDAKTCCSRGSTEPNQVRARTDPKEVLSGAMRVLSGITNRGTGWEQVAKANSDLFLLYCTFLRNRTVHFIKACICIQDFPGGPVVRNPLGNAGGTGLILGGKIPRAVRQLSPCADY